MLISINIIVAHSDLLHFQIEIVPDLIGHTHCSWQCCISAPPFSLFWGNQYMCLDRHGWFRTFPRFSTSYYRFQIFRLGCRIGLDGYKLIWLSQFHQFYVRYWRIWGLCGLDLGLRGLWRRAEIFDESARCRSIRQLSLCRCWRYHTGALGLIGLSERGRRFRLNDL